MEATLGNMTVVVGGQSFGSTLAKSAGGGENVTTTAAQSNIGGIVGGVVGGLVAVSLIGVAIYIKAAGAGPAFGAEAAGVDGMASNLRVSANIPHGIRGSKSMPHAVENPMYEEQPTTETGGVAKEETFSEFN
jgi:hypothetical protein